MTEPLGDPKELTATSTVARDWTDLRDIFYEASLHTLDAEMIPGPPLFVEALSGSKTQVSPVFGVRHQEASGRCAGHALANIVDIQRRLQFAASSGIADASTVSEDMLYYMARFHDQFTMMLQSGDRTSLPVDLAVSLEPAYEGVRSLRSVIKALYHHGALVECGDDEKLTWKDTQVLPTILQAKDARRTGLGAYYRLKPILNHYHAALKDTGSILVSATLHTHWHPDAVSENNGEIKWNGEVAEGGMHAFVIVGYTDRGFLVLNSWGAEWGGYKGLSGVALWTYQDWARNIVDGWVLRLGVSAPSAFDVSIGEQGLRNAFGNIQAGSTPCLELMGHYVHVDDGHFVEYSAYPSTQEMIDKTLEKLPYALIQGARAETNVGAAGNADIGIEPTRGLLLWIGGAMDGIDVAFRSAVGRKRLAYDLECYPFFVFWCNDFADKAVSFLREAFSAAQALSGPEAQHRDQLIENEVRGPGRAFWREVKSCARKAVWGQTSPDEDDLLRRTPHGPLGKLLMDIHTNVAMRGGGEIHVVAEGAGVLVVDEIIRMFDRLDTAEEEQLASKISTLNLILPAMRTSLGDPEKTEHEDLTLKFAKYINRRAAEALKYKMPEDWIQPAQIHVPSQAVEARVKNGAYRKSILHMIANAFEDRPAKLREMKVDGPAAAVTMMGMNAAKQMWEASHPDNSLSPFVELDQITTVKSESDSIAQQRLSKEPTLEQKVFQAIDYHARRRRGGAP